MNEENNQNNQFNNIGMDPQPLGDLKNENNKWYGIIMEIPYKTLGIEKLGKVPIINLKNTEEKVLDLIDNKEYFKAYHMNKKYWYTITLTKNINMKKLEKLIDESYNLVEKKKS